MEQMKGSPIGIDLGTAYTRAAFYDGSHCRMIPDDHGNSALPSYVAFTDSGVLVGEAARRQASQNPTNTIFDVISLIGRRYSDPSVRNDKRLWPFKVRASTDGKLLVDVLWNGKLSQFTPVDICSMILIKIKENAEKNLGAAVTDAVMTVPVYFNYEQRQAMKQAGTIAGFNILQIISAPAASALFYGMERLSKISNMINNATRSLFISEPQEHNMVIFDLGAGTLDVAAVTIKENLCKVEGTAGDIHLGGSDFDNNLIDHFINLVKQREKEDISSIPMAISNLRTFCEKAKISLSSDTISVVPVNITPLCHGFDFNSSITETKFHALNRDLFLKCIKIIVKCLRDAKMSIPAVDEVILAGGSTRIPLLQSRISDLFKGKKVIMTQNLEATTAYGAAYQAFSVSTRMNGSVHSLSLLDVAPFSLGLQSAQGEMMVYVPKNMTIPTKIKKTLPYRSPNRTKFDFKVYEGEERLTCQNRLLGKFELSVTYFSRVGCKIGVTFEVHADGALTVTAEEIFSGIRNGITIIHNYMEDSKRRVLEALVHKECESSIVQAPATKSLTSSTSGKWDQVRGKVNLAKLISMEKEMSKKIMGQSSRPYVEPEEYAIGIDFGTTYSCVAVWQRNGVKIIENEYGSRLTCSTVAFTDTGRLIGDTVLKEQVTANPASTIPNIKRLIGRCCTDQSVQDGNMFLPFRVRFNDKSRPMVLVQYKNEEKLFATEEIAAMILSKMKEIAEGYLNSKVSKAVISVPAFFSDSQRIAIRDAGVIAGLDVIQLLNEPTAAAIAYFLQKIGGQSPSEKTLLVFDLGGGNLDVSIILIKEGCVTVQAVAGDANLGGEDFDNNMVSYFVQKFMKEKKRDIRNKPRSLRRLRTACEKAKRVLSTNTQTVVEIDSLVEGIDFRGVITRKTFEEFNEDLFKRSISCVEKCLEDEMIEKSCIDEIILVGGSTRIPKMQQLLQEFFYGKELCKSINADEAVVYGSAVQAAILSRNEDRKRFNILELQDITSFSFGLENKDRVTMNLLIPRHSPIPAKKELIFSNRSDNMSNFLMEVQECELACTTVFKVSGITPKPRGNSKINLSIEVDRSGILNLTAKDISGGGENGIVISKENGGLTMGEIQKMTEAAARYKAEDEEHKATAAALNSLENLAYKVKAIARDPKVSVSASNKKSIEEYTNKAITWLESDHHIGINEINAWKMQLETFKSQLISSMGL